MKKKIVPQKNALLGALTSRDTVTGNGALSHSTSGTALLDLFSKGGALRNSGDADVLRIFASAYSEDKNLALKTLFYLGDVRQGQGERRLFRLGLNWLANNDTPTAKKLIQHVSEFTRFDNILESLENTPLEKDALKFVAKQFKADLDNDAPSLAGKWLPSEQASSDTTRRLAGKVRSELKLSPKLYRKSLSALRTRIGIVERLMASNEWKKIDFQAVPSRAALIYKTAFNKHVPELYSKFLKKVEKGEAKINAGVLYPYDLVRGVLNKEGNDLRTIEAQWKALPDYCNGENILVVCDTSGSMGTFGRNLGSNVSPIDVSVSLALYIAERNKGAFAGYFLTFNSDSHLVTVSGDNLKQKLQNVANTEWGGSTNLQSAFDSILNSATRNKVKASEMPTKLLIISDMQFNAATGRNDVTNLDAIRLKYEASGYKMPQIVFWNVNAGGDSPAKFDDKGVALVSGASPSALKSALSGKIVTPWDNFVATVSTERYEVIHV